MGQLLLIAGSCVFVGAAFGQGAEPLTFEVASVKPSHPPPGEWVNSMPPRGGPGTRDPGQITWSGVELKEVVMTAYGVQVFQIINAPDWFFTELYDIAAKVPTGAMKEQVSIMWQNLLKERFALMLHHESKEFRVDELTVAQDGPKLKLTDLAPDAVAFPPIVSLRDHQVRMIAKGLTLADLASRLGPQLHHPVIDKTGLAGRYDFTLEYAPDLASDAGSNIVSAIEKQLGLKLTSGKAKLDVIVVDHVERIPTAN